VCRKLIIYVSRCLHSKKARSNRILIVEVNSGDISHLSSSHGVHETLACPPYELTPLLKYIEVFFIRTDAALDGEYVRKSG
jgi:hypothetical protein